MGWNYISLTKHLILKSLLESRYYYRDIPDSVTLTWLKLFVQCFVHTKGWGIKESAKSSVGPSFFLIYCSI